MLSRKERRLHRRETNSNVATSLRHLSYDLHGFCDGKPFSFSNIHHLDRWAAQAADSITVTFSSYPKTHQDSEEDGRAHKNIVVSLRQVAKVFIGGQIWDSSFILATWLIVTSDRAMLGADIPRLSGSSICEVGAGVGLVGITLAKLSFPPRMVVLTDMDSVITHVTQPNIQVNFNTRSECKIIARPLDWLHRTRQIEQLLVGVTCFDYIFACDCIYSEASAVDLVLTLRDLCRLQFQHHKPRTTVYCISEMRNISIQDTFIAESVKWFELSYLPSEGDDGWWHCVPVIMHVNNLRFYILRLLPEPKEVVDVISCSSE